MRLESGVVAKRWDYPRREVVEGSAGYCRVLWVWYDESVVELQVETRLVRFDDDCRMI